MSQPLNIHFNLTEAQQEIIKDKHRFLILCCGRQFGKSYLAGSEIITYGMSNKGAVIWCISPTYRQSGYLFDKVVSMCRDNKIPITVKKSNQEMIINFTLTGSKFQALSGDDPDKLRGETLNFLVVDEAAMLKDELWSKHLRPMTAVNRSSVLFLSTPKGKNFFYDLYLLGKKEDNDWKSFHFTSYDGIICARDREGGIKELDTIKAETDDLTWRQEYLAEFLDSGGVVFNHYKAVPYEPQEVRGDTTYFVSIDLAKHGDYTVLFVADTETGQIVDYWRATGVPWESQLERFKVINEQYHYPRFFIDSTGLGDTIEERMRVEGLDVEGIVFSSKSKTQMVQNLSVMLQHEDLLVPNLPEVKDELDRYTFEQSASGTFRYSAPDGYHDDIVSSMMILAWALKRIPTDIGFVTEDELNGVKRIENSEDVFDWSTEMDKLDWETEEYYQL